MGANYQTENVNTDLITTDDLKKCKNILMMTNALLAGYEPGSNSQIYRGPTLIQTISEMFPQIKRRRVETALRQRWVTYLIR